MNTKERADLRAVIDLLEKWLADYRGAHKGAPWYIAQARTLLERALDWDARRED